MKYKLYPFAAEWFNRGQSVYLISDTHFGDTDLRAAYPNRPSDEKQIKMINQRCGRTDVLIHLGDIGDINCISKLRAGYKILICGNHDKGVSNYKHIKKIKRFDVDKYTKAEAVKEMKKLYPNWQITLDPRPLLFS